MKPIKSLLSWDTEYSADSVEWCPDQEFNHVFICGTYKLEQNSSASSVKDEAFNETKLSSQLRIGHLYTFIFQDFEPYWYKCQTIEMPAILDCKWCSVHVGGKILLAVANADGKVRIFMLSTIVGDCGKEIPQLTQMAEKELPNSSKEDNLSLSIDWSFRLNCNSYNEVNLAVSDSKGCISIFNLNDYSLEILYHWKAHEFEAWIVSYNHWNNSIVYTGGDDCRLCSYDIRCGTDRPTLVSRLHSAGVTSMHCSPIHEHTFVSGSYDESILLWDTRQMKHNKGSINVGGGVWRLKWDPCESQQLLAACMYNGFQVIDCINGCDLEIIAELKEHESIAYGADWSHMSTKYIKDNFYNSIASIYPDLEDIDDKIKLSIISTCSFYDHKLCISPLIYDRK